MRVFFKTLWLILPFALAALLMNGCKKDTIATKGSLAFSTDTLTFDTVFTTLGSTTRYFKVRNTLGQVIRIADIKLMQLQGTQFRINVDGVSGTDFKNIDIPAHDSIYVFVEVTVNPNNANNPFVITDAVQFVTNGNTQQVVLEAMGQNAHYHIHDSIESGTTVWDNDKPHIIVSRNGGLPIFQIKKNGTLSIKPRTQIYMAAGGVITVDGTLQNDPTTTWSDSVVFQGIRLDADYIDKPGQWLGITYSRGATVNLNHVIINESTVGVSDEHVLNVLAKTRITTSNIQTYSSAAVPTVRLNNCIIKNTASTAVTALMTDLKATNCLFYNGGGQMVLLGVGGSYELTNCTISDLYYRFGDHKSPSFSIYDRIADIDQTTTVGPYNTVATITNTVIDGSLDNEAFIVPQPSQITAHFKYCSIKNNLDTFMTAQPDTAFCLFNKASQFKSTYSYNFMPDSLNSPLVGTGDPAQNGQPDLFDYIRSNPISIGAIQWHP